MGRYRSSGTREAAIAEPTSPAVRAKLPNKAIKRRRKRIGKTTLTRQARTTRTNRREPSGISPSDAPSDQQTEDAIGWAREADPETLIASTTAKRAAAPTRREQVALARRVRRPVLVLLSPAKTTPVSPAVG